MMIPRAVPSSLGNMRWTHCMHTKFDVEIAAKKSLRGGASDVVK